MEVISMKEYIKPEIELLKYSFLNTIAEDSIEYQAPENPDPDHFGEDNDLDGWGDN